MQWDPDVVHDRGHFVAYCEIPFPMILWTLDIVTISFTWQYSGRFPYLLSQAFVAFYASGRVFGALLIIILRTSVDIKRTL